MAQLETRTEWAEDEEESEPREVPPKIVKDLEREKQESDALFDREAVRDQMFSKNLEYFELKRSSEVRSGPVMVDDSSNLGIVS